MPRGIENRNPGNLRWGSPWQGLLPPQTRTDKDFCQFIGAAWGIRALAMTLITYQDKYSLRTVNDIIMRWSPPGENDTASYILDVCDAVGVASTISINVHDYAVMAPLARAIIQHENGRGPRSDGSWYDTATLDEGLRMAGVVPPRTRIKPTPVGVAVTTGGIAAVAESVQQTQPVLHAVGQVAHETAGWPQWLRLVGAVLVLASLGAAGYAWWRQRRVAKAVHG